MVWAWEKMGPPQRCAPLQVDPLKDHETEVKLPMLPCGPPSLGPPYGIHRDLAVVVLVAGIVDSSLR